MKILISPFSKELRNGKINPKNYPFWQELIELMVTDGHEIMQLGVMGEPLFEKVKTAYNLSNKDLLSLLNSYDLWVSVDNFFPHFAAYHKKTDGIVLWSQSNPNIFGYKDNINIIKNITYLRPNQFDTWENSSYDINAYYTAKELYDIIKEYKK